MSNHTLAEERLRLADEHGYAHKSYCSDERPCTPCFANNGPCEDAPMEPVAQWMPIESAPTALPEKSA